MKSEVDTLKEAMTIFRKKTKASMEFCEGRLGKIDFDLDSVFLAANLIPDMTEKRDEAIIDMFNASGFYDPHQTLDGLKKFTPRSVVIKGVEYSILNKYKEKNELIFTIKPAKK